LLFYDIVDDKLHDEQRHYQPTISILDCNYHLKKLEFAITFCRFNLIVLFDHFDVDHSIYLFFPNNLVIALYNKHCSVFLQ
ncbi:hypothetical protein DERP_008147, partial [Dermatophagoides pteronyssinus]